MTPITLILFVLTFLAFSDGMIGNPAFAFGGFEYVAAPILPQPPSLPPGFIQPFLPPAPPLLVYTGNTGNQPFPNYQGFPSYSSINGIQNSVPAAGGTYSGMSASSFINSNGEGATDLFVNNNGQTYHQRILYPDNTQQ